MDEAFGVLPGKLSPRAAEQACLVAALMPFEQAADILRRLSGIRVSPDCIERTSERVGSNVCVAERAAADEGIPTTETPTFPDCLYIMPDGAMVNTREKDPKNPGKGGCWKENKLAIAFSGDDIKRSGEGEKERIRILKKRFVTSLAEPLETFKKLVHLLGARCGALGARLVVVISDGAVWIENMVAELFPNAVHILDWFHVTEKLWQCANALYGQGSSRARAWVEHYKDMLWEGKVVQVLERLLEEALDRSDQTALRELYGYFKVRTKMMRYDEFREAGLYVGSGPIESANKYVIQDRLKRAGMKWSVRGGNAIAHLRTKYLEGGWDTLWGRAGPAYRAAA